MNSYKYDKNYEQKKQEKIVELKKDLSQLLLGWDKLRYEVENFIDIFYGFQSPKTLDVRVGIRGDSIEKHVVLHLRNEKENEYGEITRVSGTVFFEGRGTWGYEISESSKGSKAYRKHGFYGVGDKLTVVQEYEGTKYTFVLPPYVAEVLSLKETYLNEYVPLLILGNKSEKNDLNIFKIEWETGRSNGILSGFGYYQKELCYFSWVEEQPYSRKRMFAVHELSWDKKINARLRRFGWKNLIKIVPSKWRNLLWFNYLSPLLKQNEENLKQGYILGYFEHD